MAKIVEVPGMGRVEFPDEMTDQEISIAIDRNMQSSVMAPKIPFSPRVEAARSVAQGATFGFADELEAALRSGQISGDQYETLRNQLRLQQGAFQKEYPIAGGITEFGGGIAVPFGAYKALGKAAPVVQEAITGVTLPGQIARGAAVGGFTGALTGAGTATSDVSGKALETGVFGFTAGAVIPPAIRGAGTVIRNILTASGVGDQPGAASKMIMNRLQKDDLTPDEAQQVLDDLRRIGVPNPTIADLGKSLRDLAYAGYVVPSKAKGATEAFLESRLIDQPNDIVKTLAKKANLSENVNGYEYLNTLIKNQASDARKAYPKAYSKAVDARDFRKYVDRPVFQQAYDEAVKRAGVRGETLPDLEQIRNAQFVPTDVLHQIKIGLDRIVESQTDITGKVTAYGRDVSQVRREFNDLIKTKNEDYRLANAKFADSERIQDAFLTGQKYQRLDPKEAMDKLKKMNPAEKESFRLGMMADINERLANFKGGDFTRQIFKSPKQKSLLRYAFEDEGKFNEFSKVVSALEDQSKTAKNIIRGSPTGERLATGESAAELGQLAQTYATRGMTGVAMDVVRQGLARTRGISSETSAELQKRLFATDPIEQRAILDELRKRTQGMRPIGNVPGAAALGTVTGLLGQ
jgi:hypothetical protein